MSSPSTKPWYWNSVDENAPDDYFAKIVAQTVPKYPPNHPRKQYQRDFYGIWTHKVTGERLLPDQFARLEMQFERSHRA